MPCSDYQGQHSEQQTTQQRLDTVTNLLCSLMAHYVENQFMSTVKDTSLRIRLGTWYERHLEDDAARKRDEETRELQSLIDKVGREAFFDRVKELNKEI